MRSVHALFRLRVSVCVWEEEEEGAVIGFPTSGSVVPFSRLQEKSGHTCFPQSSEINSEEVAYQQRSVQGVQGQ